MSEINTDEEFINNCKETTRAIKEMSEYIDEQGGADKLDAFESMSLSLSLASTVLLTNMVNDAFDDDDDNPFKHDDDHKFR